MLKGYPFAKKKMFTWESLYIFQVLCKMEGPSNHSNSKNNWVAACSRVQGSLELYSGGCNRWWDSQKTKTPPNKSAERPKYPSIANLFLSKNKTWRTVNFQQNHSHPTVKDHNTLKAHKNHSITGPSALLTSIPSLYM